MLQDKYFLEIPVYRSSPDNYKAEIENLTREVIDPDSSPDLHRYRRDGPWQYNQIIGYLRLYVTHGKDRIKAEFWRIQQERIPKVQGKKVFKMRPGNAIEIFVSCRMSSQEIYEKLLEHLESKQKSKEFKNRYIDLETFKEIASFVDWRAFIDS